jgi:DNA topoisomerase-2
MLTQVTISAPVPASGSDVHEPDSSPAIDAPAPASAADPASVASRYKKLNPREHALHRPGMYLGSVRPETVDAWVWEGGNLARRAGVRVTPGFVQAFQEVLSNAIDHSLRTKVTRIEVSVDPATGRISCSNDGESMSTEVHPEHGCRVPELVFGHMFASSNFEDDGKAVIGQNGLGAKIVNIFSKEFVVDIDDQKSRRRYRQAWSDNMAKVAPAEVSAAPKGKMPPKTCVQFLPDYARFGMPKGLDADALAAVSKCVADAAAVTPKHTDVFLNGHRFEHKEFRDYAVAHLIASGAWEPDGKGLKSRDAPIAHERFDDNWEVVVACNPDGGKAADTVRHVSFVNGLCTSRGGKHLEHVVSAVAKKLQAKLASARSKKGAPPTMRACRSALWVFVNASVPDPTFDSQTKSFLTSPPDAFRTRFECSDSLLKAILGKTGVADRVAATVAAEEDTKLKKSDGTQRSRITGLPKLDDANLAGTRRSSECTLILTEGDSAKSTAIAGLSVVGRDLYGVYPLRGKLLNVRDAGVAKISENEEIKAIKRILGLESGKDYSAPGARSGLRYGSVLLLTDQDVDGFHIKALVFNLFDSMWPALARHPGFLRSMLTPIVKVKIGRGQGQKGTDERAFFSMPEYDAWSKRASAAGTKWTAKYYKGLGTSTSDDAKRYFREMRCVEYTVQDGPGGPPSASAAATERNAKKARVAEVAGGGGAPAEEPAPATSAPATSAPAIPPLRSDADALDMAFRKNRAEDRKRWLLSVDPNDSLDPNVKRIRMADFVDRELCQFSWEDVHRSLPRVEDGLKCSQRKVLFGALSRSPNADEMRVAQLAGHVSTVAAYHHGEASLQQTIIGMAQGFVGCGHARFLTANGQFGTRIHGGKDSASPRYIHTQASATARAVHPKADEAVLPKALDDDMRPVEPVVYAPVLPTILLNGTSGIGTGWSTSVPCLSPDVVASAYVSRLSGGSPEAFRKAIADAPPTYKGFTGAIVPKREEGADAGANGRPNFGRWTSLGKWDKKGAKEVSVTELPIGVWTADFKENLEKVVAAASMEGLKSYDAQYTDEVVSFALQFESAQTRDAALAKPVEFATALKLSSDRGLSTTNMHLLDVNGKVRRYENCGEIAEDHFLFRRGVYGRRLAHEKSVLGKEVAVLRAKLGFVDDVLSGELKLLSPAGSSGAAKEEDVRAHCRERGWPASADKPSADEAVAVAGTEAGTGAEAVTGTGTGTSAEEAIAPSGTGAQAFEYLLALPSGTFTLERRDKLVKDVRDREAALEALEKETVESVWIKEIGAAMATIKAK